MVIHGRLYQNAYKCKNFVFCIDITRNPISKVQSGIFLAFHVVTFTYVHQQLVE